MRIFLLIFCSLLVQQIAYSQKVTGKVLDNNKEVLIGASVYWLGTTNGTSTDTYGRFEISETESTNRLIVSFIGYQSDTITVLSQKHLVVRLKEEVLLEEVIISGRKEGAYISKIDPIKTKTITQDELTKGACCDLAGCFGTDGSVQPTTTNIVTNSKELRIMGLSGVYSQVLIDGMPLIQGLPYTYGISSYPGTLVENIFVVIGANSVLQGFESINGQINIQLKNPKESDKFFVNLYANNFLEQQANISYSKKFKKWRTLLAVHSTQPGKKIDRDQDTFRDLPQTTKYSIFNKWKLGDPNTWGFHSMIGLRYVDEGRVGGQMGFDVNTKLDTSNYYGQKVAYSQAELYTKTGYRFDDKKSLVLLSSMVYHDQKSSFGTTRYDAKQLSFYGNLQYELKWNKTHLLKAGLSLRNNEINEQVSFLENSLGRTYDGIYNKEEIIPGVFVENVFNWKARATLITGLRVDHDKKNGSFATPRAMFKFNITENTTLRLSGGTGYRTVNLFSENINLLASSRDVVITEELKPETAINWGANLVQTKYWDNLTATFGVDFYRTQFTNQIFPDYDTDHTKAIISNFSGTSISNGLQVETMLKFYDVFNFTISFNYLDVYQMINDHKKILPFNPKYKVISSFSYKPKSKKWHADVNLHWHGKQYLVDAGPIYELGEPSQSKEYYLVNAQFTKVWKRFDVYIGCENIFDYRQVKPIEGWQDPFGSYFDTSNVWGPTRGREFYMGLRFRVK